MTGGGADARQHSPSAARNTEPILAVLRNHLPPSGRVLEIASGTGQHIVAFAGAFPGLDFFPSDPSPVSRASIAAWTRVARAGNVAAPCDIDVADAGWADIPAGPFAAIIAINLVHISPWEAAVGLIGGAARLLTRDGLLYLYGPFSRGGRHISESNAAFDWSLKRQHPGWGVRDLDDVGDEVEGAGLTIAEVIAMPANNLSLIIRRRFRDP